jgi:hypothetical protein
MVLSNGVKGSGKSAFGVFSEPKTASDYLYDKKAKTTFCLANKCIPSRKVNTESNLLLLNRANNLKYYPCKNFFNKANLNVNLITKLDLKDVPVIANFSDNAVPTTVTQSAIPFLDYNIDPNGLLFGNTICGVNNYVSFMVYNPRYQTINPTHINNL